MISAGDLVRYRNCVIRPYGEHSRKKRGSLEQHLRGKQDIMRALRVYKDKNVMYVHVEGTGGRKNIPARNLVVHRKDPMWIVRETKRQERRRTGRWPAAKAVRGVARPAITEILVDVGIKLADSAQHDAMPAPGNGYLQVVQPQQLAPAPEQQLAPEPAPVQQNSIIPRGIERCFIVKARQTDAVSVNTSEMILELFGEEDHEGEWFQMH